MDSKKQRQSLEFLKIDFQECFEQMRHYDRLFWQVTAGIFSLDAAILATVFNLLKSKYFSTSILGILVFGGFIIGIIVLCFLLKNRIYYVKVARFVNEVRRQYLENKPLEVENQAKLYTDPEYPKYSNLASSQLASIYIMIIINSFYAFVGLLFLTENFVIALLSFVFLLIIQVILTICFLRSKEKSLRRETNG